MSDSPKRNFKVRECRLCGAMFKPKQARSLRCPACRDIRCVDCGKKINTKTKRLLNNPERRCMACWKRGVSFGTRRLDANGYVSIKTRKGWKLEHRYLMEKKLKRPLKRGEIVHHIDGNRSNNKLSNLVLCKGLREHLDKYHKDDLVSPPVHHNSRRPKGHPDWVPVPSPKRKWR